jgi:hypothetical protein
MCKDERCTSPKAARCGCSQTKLDKAGPCSSLRFRRIANLLLFEKKLERESLTGSQFIDCAVGCTPGGDADWCGVQGVVPLLVRAVVLAFYHTPSNSYLDDAPLSLRSPLFGYFLSVFVAAEEDDFWAQESEVRQ